MRFISKIGFLPLLAAACASSAVSALGQSSDLASPAEREPVYSLTVVQSWPIDAAHQSGGGERATAGATYSNIDTFQGFSTSNGGASGAGSSAITRLLADDITTFSASTNLGVLQFGASNSGGTSVSTRMRLRFWKADGASGTPGTIIFATTFNAVTIPANTVQLFNVDLTTAMITLPQKFWAGLVFDAGGSPTATLAQLNGLGMPGYNAPNPGVSANLGFQSTAAGSFAASNPAGSTFTLVSPPANYAFEINPALPIPTGACCFETIACTVVTQVNCLNSGGIYRGNSTTCAASCELPYPAFLEPPPAGSKFLLDQISLVNPNNAGLVERRSQQFVSPPATDNRNIAFIDEFTTTTTQVVTRVDAITTNGIHGTEPPQNGFLVSIWNSKPAATSDLTLQSNTFYNQGYTVPILFRGGGEYEPFAACLGHNGWLGIKAYANPAISNDSSSLPGVVLPAGTYYVAMIHRAPFANPAGYILDSDAQDPRFFANNAFLSNPGGGLSLPGGSPQNTNTPAAYRVVGRNCRSDLNGDGIVGTTDLVGLLALFGQEVPQPGAGADSNGDGVVTTTDLVDLLSHFGQPCS